MKFSHKLHATIKVALLQSMVVPEDQDGKTDQCVMLQRGAATPEKDTRKGGQAEEPAKRVVIVDMREFRSDLPSLIHKRGIEIEPVTITVRFW